MYVMYAGLTWSLFFSNASNQYMPLLFLFGAILCTFDRVRFEQKKKNVSAKVNSYLREWDEQHGWAYKYQPPSEGYVYKKGTAIRLHTRNGCFVNHDR